MERNLWPVENEINVVKGVCVSSDPKRNWAKKLFANKLLLEDGQSGEGFHTHWP